MGMSEAIGSHAAAEIRVGHRSTFRRPAVQQVHDGRRKLGGIGCRQTGGKHVLGQAGEHGRRHHARQSGGDRFKHLVLYATCDEQRGHGDRGAPQIWSHVGDRTRDLDGGIGDGQVSNGRRRLGPDQREARVRTPRSNQRPHGLREPERRFFVGPVAQDSAKRDAGFVRRRGRRTKLVKPDAIGHHVNVRRGLESEEGLTLAILPRARRGHGRPPRTPTSDGPRPRISAPGVETWRPLIEIYIDHVERAFDRSMVVRARIGPFPNSRPTRSGDGRSRKLGRRAHRSGVEQGMRERAPGGQPSHRATVSQPARDACDRDGPGEVPEIGGVLFLVPVVHERHQIDLGVGRQQPQDVECADPVAAVGSVRQAVREKEFSPAMGEHLARARGVMPLRQAVRSLAWDGMLD